MSVDMILVTVALLLSISKLSLTSSNASGTIIDYIPSINSAKEWSPSDILRGALTHDDYEDRVVTLREGVQTAYQLKLKSIIRLIFPVTVMSPLSLSFSPCYGDMKWTLSYRRPSFLQVEVVASQGQQSQQHYGIVTDVSSQSIVNDMNKPIKQKKRRRVRKLGEGRRTYKCVGRIGNFSTVLLENPKATNYSKGRRSYQEVDLSYGTGDKPWIFQRKAAEPGLYIIKIQSISSESRLNAAASRRVYHNMDPSQALRVHKSKKSMNDHSLTLSWNKRRFEGTLSCLAISRQRFYSSYCEAKNMKNVIRRPHDFDGSILLGCTPDMHYTLPVTSHSQYYVSIWEQNSLIPFVQATIEAKRERMLRLRPGVMVSFTLNGGGVIEVRFNVRKPGKKLHIGAVSCVGGIKVLVLARNKKRERIAMARGREALHLAIKNIPMKKLIIRVSPESSATTIYRVHLVVTHSARRLPIPRLPKDVTVGATPLNCSAALIDWGRAPGGATYCVALRPHPSGRPPEIRPPIQCGWEHVIKRNGYFELIKCIGPTTVRKQTLTVSGLSEQGSYLVNVIVRHPNTGKTLALSPAMLNLPSCSTHSSENDT